MNELVNNLGCKDTNIFYNRKIFTGKSVAFHEIILKMFARYKTLLSFS